MHKRLKDNMPDGMINKAEEDSDKKQEGWVDGVSKELMKKQLQSKKK